MRRAKGAAQAPGDQVGRAPQQLPELHMPHSPGSPASLTTALRLHKLGPVTANGGSKVTWLDRGQAGLLFVSFLFNGDSSKETFPKLEPLGAEGSLAPPIPSQAHSADSSLQNQPLTPPTGFSLNVSADTGTPEEQYLSWEAMRPGVALSAPPLFLGLLHTASPGL